ncbi:MAG: hypothetical protein L0Y79_05555 [Chlorobi bacterium]|nr:hypothetical protein [Chlorobiota bacterium]MCI0716491.1 hypothetical protein [Chlorobiota bacterium]
MHKKITSYKKLVFVAAYIAIITFFDVYCYGIIYKQKIQSENYNPPQAGWLWVFEESGSNSAGENPDVPRYRIIQKAVEISGIAIIFYICGLWAAIGLLLSHYLLSYDLLYYIILNQTHLFKIFEKGINAYWLTRPYQIGYFILKPFNSLYFYTSGFIGLAAAIGFCFLPVERKNTN